MEIPVFPDDPAEPMALSFALSLVQMLPAFGTVYEDYLEERHPLKPRALPLLSDLGSAFATNYLALTPERSRTILARVEEAAARDDLDDYLGTVVCTGFLESLIHRAERSGVWHEVVADLGPASRAYAEAYRSAPFHNQIG